MLCQFDSGFAFGWVLRYKCCCMWMSKSVAFQNNKLSLPSKSQIPYHSSYVNLKTLHVWRPTSRPKAFKILVFWARNKVDEIIVISLANVRRGWIGIILNYITIAHHSRDLAHGIPKGYVKSRHICKIWTCWLLQFYHRIPMIHLWYT